MSGKILPLIVADGDTLSEEKSLMDKNDLVHCALAGVECPAAVDGTEGTVEYSRDDGATWNKVYVDGDPVVIPLASADANDVNCFSAVVPGYHFALGTKFRFRCATEQTDDRVFNLVFAEAVGR